MSLQPRLATKDVLILVFMFMLWGYSLYLTYRAWYKLLYSGGEDSGTNMWRYILDMVTLKKRNETRRKTLIDTELHKDINTSPILWSPSNFEDHPEYILTFIIIKAEANGWVIEYFKYSWSKTLNVQTTIEIEKYMTPSCWIYFISWFISWVVTRKFKFIEIYSSSNF